MRAEFRNICKNIAVIKRVAGNIILRFSVIYYNAYGMRVGMSRQHCAEPYAVLSPLSVTVKFYIVLIFVSDLSDLVKRRLRRKHGN